MRLDKVGIWFYFMCFCIPTLFNAFFFWGMEWRNSGYLHVKVLPMGDPDSKRLWVLTVRKKSLCNGH